MRVKRKVLLVGGTVNQIKMMHRIAEQLDHARCTFTPFYHLGRPHFALAERLGLLRYTLGKPIQRQVRAYLRRHNLSLDYQGRNGPYALVSLGTVTYIPHNLKPYPKVLVQEGLVYAEGDIAPMTARFTHFVTTTSTTIFPALACDKPLTCDEDLELMRRLLPAQIGHSAANIAALCKRVLAGAVPKRVEQHETREQSGRDTGSQWLKGDPG
jgi:hypothetical protein